MAMPVREGQGCPTGKSMAQLLLELKSQLSWLRVSCQACEALLQRVFLTSGGCCTLSWCARSKFPWGCFVFGAVEVGFSGEISRDVLRFGCTVWCVGARAEPGGSEGLRGHTWLSGV